MPNHYHDILFTDEVKAMQSKIGSREMYARHEVNPLMFHDQLTEAEISFIEAQDSFYMASISTSGWPYVQHRGGQRGFLKHIGENTLAFADFTGNKQYISAGNVVSDDRISIILMDYTLRRRIKLLGHIKVVDAPEQKLIDQLVDPNYPAPVERVFKINVEAFEWNCPKYITERYSIIDVHKATEAMRLRIAKLENLLEKSGIEIPA